MRVTLELREYDERGEDEQQERLLCFDYSREMEECM
jgi:hypothetical protein